MTKLEETHGIKLFGKTIQLHDPKTEEQPPSLDKRPDKIIPCPRCKSMETKFCYFNNYNVNQPRHFCKGCQRYWTAGGALRNVPVGAGRRKAKLLAHQTLPENCVLVDGAAFQEYWAHHHHQQLLPATAAAASGGCGGYYPAKRRRDVSYGQTNGSSQDV